MKNPKHSKLDNTNIYLARHVFKNTKMLISKEIWSSNWASRSPLTAGEFWSHWLQYLAIFTIFRNFFFILYLAPAIICNVVDWSADSILYLGKFSYHAGPIFTHIPAPEKKRGCKISEMAPFDLDEFLPENAFFDFKKVYIFI